MNHIILLLFRIKISLINISKKTKKEMKAIINLPDMSVHVHAVGEERGQLLPTLDSTLKYYLQYC